MKIVKGDTVYLRSGKDVAGQKQSRLEKALHIGDSPQAQTEFRERLKTMPMAEQIAEANKESGVRGKVLRVLPREGKVVVEGLNMVTKHQKPKATGGAAQVQQGGRIKMEAPIPIGRVMLVCPNCDKPTRVATRAMHEERQTLDGTKTVQVRQRVCKQCGQLIAKPTAG